MSKFVSSSKIYPVFMFFIVFFEWLFSECSHAEDRALGERWERLECVERLWRVRVIEHDEHATAAARDVNGLVQCLFDRGAQGDKSRLDAQSRRRKIIEERY